MEYNLSLDTLVEFNLKNSVERTVLKELYEGGAYSSEEELFNLVAAWIHTGRAKIIDQRTREEKIADQIASELLAVDKGKTIEQDRVDRVHYNDGSHGFYKKVGFPAKTLLYAQEMHQQLIRNFNIRPDQLGVQMENGQVLVTITECPIKVYCQIERAFGIKRATETVTNTVEKTANGLVNATDLTINTLAIPVAKTAIGTTTKVAKSLVGLGAKLGGILVGEVVKSTKQCCTEIANDGYIAEAKGEVIDGVHTIRRAAGSLNMGGYGGVVLDN